MGVSKRNAEGYYDPTAYEALISVEREQHKMKCRPLVFICLPTTEDATLNIENAKQYSMFAVAKGSIPIAPHLLFSQFMDEGNDEQCKLGISFGMVLMNKCNEVWVFGKVCSCEMKQEITNALKRHMVIRHFDEHFREL